MGWPRGVPQRRLSDEDRSEVVRLHSEGLTRIQIAERMGCHRRTVATILTAARLVEDAVSSKPKSVYKSNGKAQLSPATIEHGLASPMRVSCRCGWSTESRADIGMAAFREHRDQEHGET